MIEIKKALPHLFEKRITLAQKSELLVSLDYINSIIWTSQQEQQ